jgi:hypothetical protein
MSEKKKWSADSAANELLKKLFKEEKINSSDVPKDIYNKYPEFQEYAPNVFRAHFYTCRNQFGQGCKFWMF